MKCKVCGKEWSNRVYYIHIKDCKEPEKAKKIIDIDESKEEITTETDLTKGLIVQELRRRDIPHNPRDKKEILLNILNESKEAV